MKWWWGILVCLFALSANAQTKVVVLGCTAPEQVEIGYFVPVTTGVGTYKKNADGSLEETALETAHVHFMDVFTGKAPYDILLDRNADGRITPADWTSLLTLWKSNPTAYQVGNMRRLDPDGAIRGNRYRAGQCIDVVYMPTYFVPVDMLYQRCIKDGVPGKLWGGPAEVKAVPCNR